MNLLSNKVLRAVLGIIAAGLSWVNTSPNNLKLVPIDSLSLWDENYRLGDVDAIANSISRFGFNGALRTWKGTVVAGNHALKALLALREQSSIPTGIQIDGDTWLIPVITVDHLSRSEARAFAIADNRTQQLGEDDDDKLLVLLQSLSIEDPSLVEDAGYSDDDLKALLGELCEPRILDSDNDDEPTRADELQEKWQVQVGDRWLLGNHVVACGSSMDREFVKSVSPGPCRLIWTDPPYGIDYSNTKDQVNKANGNKTRKRKSIANDDDGAPAVFQAFLEAADCLPGCSVYASTPGGPLYAQFIAAMDAAGFPYRHMLVWVKNSSVFGRSDYHYKHEPIMYGWKGDGAHYFSPDRSGKCSVFEVDRPQVSSEHPTMKPIELIRPMIANSSRPGDTVYDGFSGSGSTLLACEAENRIGFGIDIEPAFVSVTLERFQKIGIEPQRQT